MSSTNTASTRTCPVCNAPNSNFSLFCAECGSSLNAPEEGDTAAFRPVPASDTDDSQRTAAFEPGSYTDDASNSTRVATDPPATGYRSTWEETSAAPTPASPVWSTPDVTFQPDRPATAPQGIRSFVLGTIAVLLVLAVFLLWTWAAILDEETRDSIQDFFGFIG
ncbi:MAG: hypothetical protein H0T72_09930 [Chloroflexia bacterium]|nr:hypothetical protein [Chloroflexia bacterium]